MKSNISVGRDGVQVGLVLDGNAVEYVLGGSPASLSQDIRKGDRILKVDDTTISDSTLLKDMLVNGTPGSSVSLTIETKNEASPSTKHVVLLTRIASNALANRTHMYDIEGAYDIQMPGVSCPPK